MSPYSSMLQKASMEMRQFQQARRFEKGWLEQFAVRLEHASRFSEAVSAEREILAIARIDIDSGPSIQTAMPSFYPALDGIQIARKRRPV